MRFLVSALLASVFIFQSTDNAEARRGGGSQEALEFIAPTKLVNGVGDLSLCHLVDHTTVFSMPVITQSEGYALANNKCDSETYFPVEPAEFLEMQRGGMVAANLPPAPSLSTTAALRNVLLVAVLGLGLLVFLYKKASVAFGFGGRRGSKKSASLAHNTLDAMCHIAKSDGHVDDQEVMIIAGICQKMTGQSFNLQEVKAIVESSASDLYPTDFKRFAKGLDAAQSRVLLQAVLLVAGGDGMIAREENIFIGHLANALGIPTGEAADMLMAVTRSSERPGPRVGGLAPA